MKVKKITRRHYAGKVYNIETPPHHCYYADRLLIHNCYQSSGPKGKHGEFDKIQSLFWDLHAMEVFEVALGGGEATEHPEFVGILASAHNYRLVPNFSTGTLKWLKDRTITDAVARYCGGFAVSVRSSKEVYDANTAIRNAGAFGGRQDIAMPSLQYVMGSTDMDTFEEILRAAENVGYTITLLGFKFVGRGTGFKPYPYDGWIRKLQEVRDDLGYGLRVGVDTALAVEYENEILALTSAKFVQFREGDTSMYIDAVEGKAGPYSFCDPSQLVTFGDRRYVGSTHLTSLFRHFQGDSHATKDLTEGGWELS